MNIEESVQDLLMMHDCVIIPQFGAFVSDYETASFSMGSTTRFLPPSKKLIFNSKLTYNDGLLFNHISKTYNLSFNDAAGYVQKYIWNLELSLKQNKNAQFGVLGQFTMPKAGVIAFEPQKHDFLLTDSFGLGTFEFRILNDQSIIRAKRTFNLHDMARKAVNRKIMKPVLYTLPLIIAAGIIQPFIADDIQTSSLDIITTTVSEIKIEDTQIKEPKTETVIKAQTETLIDKHLAEVNDQRSELAYTEPEYFIIVGSFKDEANAMQYMSKPVFNIVPASLIFTDNLYRVSIGKFDAKRTARIKLAELRTRNRELKDAWVYTSK